MVGTFRIFQPGSSIATSLVEGESRSNPKHMGLIEIREKKFRMFPLKFTQVRPFIFADVILKDIAGLRDSDPKIEEKIKVLLTAKVQEMVKAARNDSEEVRNSVPDLLYRVKDPSQVLVRLRVDHTGFPTLNQQRFGAEFVGEVANPSDILSFTKKKAEMSRAVEGYADHASRIVHLVDDADGAEETIKIEELVKETLSTGNKHLSLLLEVSLLFLFFPTSLSPVFHVLIIRMRTI